MSSDQLEIEKNIEYNINEENSNSDKSLQINIHHFGKNVDGIHYSCRNIDADCLNIEDCSFLENHRYIEVLSIANNRINNLEFIQNLRFLSHLNLSNNLISDATGLANLIYLQRLNISSNFLKETSFLSSLRALEEINFSGNQLQILSGIEKCLMLQSVDISHNLLTEIPNIQATTLRNLNLKNNKINTINGLNHHSYLTDLDLTSNKISDLKGFNVSSVVKLYIENNEIFDIHQLNNLSHLKLLSTLTLNGNLLNNMPDYPLLVIYYLLQLESLDGEVITTKMKVNAVNYFDPSNHSLAANDHRTQLIYNLQESNSIRNTTIPEYHVPYPLFIIMGPPGSCKKLLCMKLEEEFNKNLKYATPHTTRQPYSFEKNGTEYYFVTRSNFKQDVKEGKFIQTITSKGEYYGLKHHIVDNIAAAGLSTITHLDIEGVLALKMSFWKPKLILIVFDGSDAQMQLMRLKSTYTDEDMTHAIIQKDIYMQFHNQNNGFFDLVVRLDSLESAYQQLSDYFSNILFAKPKND